ncbi:triose-phosphate isomerase [Candidatus Micrarchaeota archaeon]|nr:triose-phosphate isomerase [Candidatus Micrarchaeota archaeon]
MKKFVVFNLKVYHEGRKNKELVNAAEEMEREAEKKEAEILVAPPSLDLKELASVTKNAKIIAQHADCDGTGAHTGSVPIEHLRLIGVVGTLINHSEHRIPIEKIKATIQKAKELNLISIVCVQNDAEAKEVAPFNPTAVAYEPPYLIGSKEKSVATEPEKVLASLKAVRSVNPKVRALIGAGLRKPEDFRKSAELGADGVLLASAFVEAPEPKAYIKMILDEFCR